MGRLIETPFIAHSELTNGIYIIDKKDKYCVTDQVIKAVESTNRAIPKADYEARLKADLKAILVELQLKVEEIEIDVPFGFEPVSKTSAFYEGVSASSKVIQQKINELKGGSEDV